MGEYMSSLEEMISQKSTSIVLDNYDEESLPEAMGTADFVVKLSIRKGSLRNLNNLPPNLVRLKLVCQNLAIIGDLPHTIKHINLTGNSLTTLPEFHEGLESLKVNDNKLNTLPDKLPSTLKTLLLADNLLKSFNVNCSVETLDISNNCIDSIDKLPDTIKKLVIDNNSIDTIKTLPKELVEFSAYNSDIQSIECAFPESLKKLDLFKNKLQEIQDLHDGIVEIDLMSNSLTRAPKFSENAKQVDLRDNKNIDLSDVTELIANIRKNNGEVFFDDKEEERGFSFPNLSQLLGSTQRATPKQYINLKNTYTI